MTSDTTTLFAPAKINLTLHVTGQRADGYHLLDSLVVFADVGDHLTLTASDQITIEVTGPFATGVPRDHRNLVWQALEMAQRKCHVSLEKNLPHGAGIGGGSSDAGAILRHFGVTEGAVQLGADVPVCLHSSAQRMQGVGEVLTILPKLPPIWAVLANPGHHVPTPQVFKALTCKENAPMLDVVPEFPTSAVLIDWLRDQRNDLEPPAQHLVPEISDVLRALKAQEGAELVRMSGSGATCFALFADPRLAAKAVDVLRAETPNWWVCEAQLS